jgi:hypothetical protein
MFATVPNGRWRPFAPCLLAAFVAFAPLSHAQFGGGMGGMGGMRPGGGGGPGPRGEVRPPAEGAPSAFRENPGVAILRDLNETRELLQLKPGQRDAWARYADRVTALAADLLRAPNPARFENKPAPRQFDALADAARDRFTAVEDMVDAGKALYASLDGEQKALADGRLARIALPLLDSGAEASRRSPGVAPSGEPATPRKEPH